MFHLTGAMQAAKTSTDNKATAKNVTQVPFATEEEFDRYFDNLDEKASGGIQLAASTASSETTQKFTSPEESVDQASRVCHPTSTTLYIDNDDPGNLANSESEDDLLLSTSKGENSPSRLFSANKEHKSRERTLARLKLRAKKRGRSSILKGLKRMKRGKQQRVLTVFKNCDVTIFEA
ncbi:hypothetical protein VFPPC_12234 [Pochonia chlamydosporia 170]|uniref:Uncharacterized protein n=1 Tax=Pochonia chlamydosporia 170 TaxID=1380566 RepID=A0A179EYL7_METCM|nr:hypothetical protein VFPPC_12234 [Pochonia chlamydosporia 170]OAQ58268.1 hypothetical protein VFPPC_12234 [Pochonia chlamydosporia 170]